MRIKLPGFITLAAATVLLLASNSPSCALATTISNPLSGFAINPDGAYSPSNEWSDIKPAWFTSSPVTGATPVAAGAAGANSLLFAGLSRDTPTSQPELYLMYDYLARTNAPTQNNEFLGSISFPLTINGVSQNSTVTFKTVSNFTSLGSLTPTNFWTATVSINGGAPVAAASLGIEAGLFVGTTPVNALWGVTASSPFHTTFHELIELGVPLVISPAFVAAGGPGSPFTPTGPGFDGYSPDPAFWQSNISDNAGDPPASGGSFTINPNGSTDIVPEAVPTPEPSSFILAALGGLGLWAFRRNRRVAA